MKTDNELIAEFLGWSRLDTEHDTFWHPTEKCTLDNWKYHTLDLAHKFPVSWDWLMPVVERCNYTPDIPGKMMEGIDKWNVIKERFHTDRGTNHIHMVYTAVVDFIKWYNENKEQ